MMMDTPVLAKKEYLGNRILVPLVQEQEIQEANVDWRLEAELHRHGHPCRKHPDHLQFVPVDQFNVDHLPPDYHDPALVDLVRAMSNVTVRVSVSCVSERRPESFPGSCNPYPYHRNRDNDIVRLGTGLLYRVYTFPDRYNTKVKTCECIECLNSTPKMQFGHILITTSANVVYDDLEAAKTTCHLVLYQGDSPNASSDVITLSGMSLARSDVMTDICVMKYVTHDMDLVDKLDNMVTAWDELHHSFAYNCLISTCDRKKESPQVDANGDVKLPLVIIVSHPHGLSKQVSVGYCMKIIAVGNGWTKFVYNTSTCPGTNGATVHKLAKDCTKLDADHSHSWGCKTFNGSSFGIG